MYYSSKPVTKYVTLIQSPSGEDLYLIAGQERAILIDANMGVGRLRNFVESLTSKPLTVLLSHGHVDHAPGAVEFDDVYMNSRDLELYRSHCTLEARQGYLKGNLGDRYEELTAEGLLPAEPDKKFKELEDDMVFDLGGVRLRTVAFPGHTPGSTAFLVEEDRLLILGDACNNFTFLFTPGSSSVEEYRKAALQVQKKMAGKYDRIFVSHREPEMPASLLDEMVQLCDEVLAGQSDEVPFTFMEIDAVVAKKTRDGIYREDGKTANLVYRKDHLYGK